MKKSLWSVLTTGTLLITSAPQSAYALSLACCNSLEEMEQSSDLIIRGRALAGFEEMQALQQLSDAEYQALIAAGKPLPQGTSIIGGGEDQFIRQETTIPVEVLEIIKGETNEQTINVVQHNGWGAIPMKKGSEYLLFLYPPLPSGSSQDFYYNFYGQGTYNLDGTDPRTSSALFYDTDAVKERYEDRIRFVFPPSEKTIGIVQLKEENQITWFSKWVSTVQRWFKAN